MVLDKAPMPQRSKKEQLRFVELFQLIHPAFLLLPHGILGAFSVEASSVQFGYLSDPHSSQYSIIT